MVDQDEMRDALGNPISLGSVIRHVEETDTQGVVVHIVSKTGVNAHPITVDGDLIIQLSNERYGTRVSRNYRMWVLVPHENQTFAERYLAWTKTRGKYYPSGSDRISNTEKRAISGIMSLLPEDVVNWEEGPWPDTLDDALRFMADYLMDNVGSHGGA